MKKAIRILIPLILAVAIVLCTAWYLFIYDREFTRDVFVFCARYFEQNGKHETSSWLYDLAYRQAGDNDAIAIELANQHKKGGNYTKAEYTLSKAISDGGSIELYTALCQTYLEQDKVLDAVNMLNNISNPELKAQLDALRPAAPACSPEPGFYSQYISVSVESDVPTLLVNTDGEYPSTQEDFYDIPVKLQEGENTLYAVAVSPEGLVSPISIFGFTVGGVIEEVVFNDDVLESAIRQQLAVSEDKALYSNDLWTITEFTVPSGATNYDVLRYMAFLETLTIDSGVGGQLSVLSHLSNLKTLQITNTKVQAEELSMIGTLPNLTTLTLNNCGLSTIAGLETADTVTTLDLGNNTIRDLSALAAMTELTHLSLQHNAVNTVAALSGLTNLSTLDLSYNTLRTLTPLSGHAALTVLYAGNNALASVEEIASCKGLQQLNLDANTISDISAISDCTALTHLSVADNQLTKLDGIEDLLNLTNLNFANNQVTELPAFSEDCSLVNIDGSYNLLTTLEPLKDLKNLNNVYMDYNSGISSVEVLKDCPNLIQVNVYGTKVKKVTALTEQSIIVNYDPTN